MYVCGSIVVVCGSIVVLWQYCSNVCSPQGDQGLQGQPGPFEYVDPPEDLYLKGDKVGGT